MNQTIVTHLSNTEGCFHNVPQTLFFSAVLPVSRVIYSDQYHASVSLFIIFNIVSSRIVFQSTRSYLQLLRTISMRSSTSESESASLLVMRVAWLRRAHKYRRMGLSCLHPNLHSFYLYFSFDVKAVKSHCLRCPSPLFLQRWRRRDVIAPGGKPQQPHVLSILLYSAVTWATCRKLGMETKQIPSTLQSCDTWHEMAEQSPSLRFCGAASQHRQAAFSNIDD